MFERFSRSARAAVVLAQEEARDAGADRIEPIHLLVGVLDSADDPLRRCLDEVGLTIEAVRASGAGRVITDPDAAALKSIGIDVAGVADVISKRFGFDILRPIRKRFRAGNIPFASGAKRSLELALRESVDRKDGAIEAAHVLLGVLRSNDGEALTGVQSVVAEPELRRHLYALLDRPAA